MKKLLLSFSILMSCTVLLAQTPESFKYQAVLRNIQGSPLLNKDANLKISILKTSIDGSAVYTEFHKITTNILGMINLNIGMGQSSDNFSDINWGIDKFFLKIELRDDRTGIFEEIGTSQLLSVPYALHSKTTDNSLNDEVNDADADPENEIQTMFVSKKGDTLYLSKSNFVIIPGISQANHKPSETVTDYDGNNYKTIKIGEQLWMAENLKTGHYSDGTAISLITDNSAWGDLEDDNNDKAYCYNENDPKSEYGALYTWAAATNGIPSTSVRLKVQGACPNGWHIPNDVEWKALSDYLGGASISGGKLKESGTKHWLSPNTGATNESGYTALPGGYRRANDGNFDYQNRVGLWWSASVENDEPIAWGRALSFDSEETYRNYYDKSYGLSVRCIKN